MRPGAAMVIAALVASTPAPAAGALLSPEHSDAVLLASCREYAKAKKGQRADQVAAQACKSFMAGYAMGWQNRQNTPTSVVPTAGCVDLEKDTGRLIAAYLADEKDGAMPFPPSVAMMGELTQRFPCPSGRPRR